MPDDDSSFVVRQMARSLNVGEYSKLAIPTDMSTEQLATLRTIYSSRMGYHSDQTSRMWTRYAFLVTLEVALTSLALSSSMIGTYILGVVTSLLGYLFLVQERYFFLGLRTECAHLERCLLEGAKIAFIPGFGTFSSPKFTGQSIIRQNFWAWTREVIITSRLIIYSTFGFLAAWVVALIWRIA